MYTNAKLFFVVLLLVPLVSAACPFVGVSLIPSASVFQGQEAVYAISLTNQGLSNQLVYLSMQCPAGVNCRFSEVPSKTLVASEEKTFTLTMSSDVPAIYSIPLLVSTGSNYACDTQNLNLEVKAFSTPASDSFSVSMTPTINQSARPGETVNYELTISNNQKDVSKSFAQLSHQGFFDSVIFTPVDLDLPAGASKKVSVKVIIPPGTPAGVYKDNVRVRIANQDGVQTFYDFPIQVFVFSQTVQLAVQNEPVGCIPVLHDEENKWIISLKNNGESSGPFRVSVEGSDAVQRIVSLDRNLVEIVPGDKQDVTFSLAASNRELLGNYYFTVNVDYLDFNVYRQDYCFKVYSKNDFQVIQEPEYLIKRGKANQLIPFSIVNNGSLQESFSIEVAQYPMFLVQAEPKSFVLGPGRKQDVELIASTSLDRTELKTYPIQAIIRTSKVAKLVVFNITVVPDEQNSFLIIDSNQLQAVAGEKSIDYVTVRNLKSSVLRGVTLVLEGLDSSWYFVKFAKRDINGFDSTKYEVELTVPKGAKPINQFNITVSSLERELAKRSAVLYVDDSQGVLRAHVERVDYSANGEAMVLMTVSNNGDSTIQSITPYSNAAVLTSDPSSFDLKPGESKTILLTVSQSSGESVPVFFNNANGITGNLVAVPVKKIVVQSTPWLWIGVAAVLLILVAYFFWVKPEQNNYLTG